MLESVSCPRCGCACRVQPHDHANCVQCFYSFRPSATNGADHFKACARCGQTVITRAEIPMCGTCKAISEDPSLLASYGPAADAIAASCRYGQAFDESNDHYEETNSAGWDLEADILAAVAVLTGDADPATVNPDFPGWWAGHTP